MHKILKPYSILSLLLFVIAFIFIVKAGAQNSRDLRLESDDL